ncbi:hemicentin-1-like isoform X2 [Mytilus galloprovincialis]|uniref:hemicentin-1-like isoform X2 n=1 Tax=Mytilus galloprovincialis TaxID=29158 RepID=UPI003F7C702E
MASDKTNFDRSLETDALPTVDSADKKHLVRLKEEHEQHGFDRSETHLKQPVQSEQDVRYSGTENYESQSPSLNSALTEDRQTNETTSEDQSRRLSRLSLNLEIPLVPENIDNSNLPTRSTDTVLTGYRGNPANTCGPGHSDSNLSPSRNNTERISRKNWKAIKIFVLAVEQTFINNKKWLQFSEALGYDMKVVRRKIGSKPDQFYKLLNEWLDVMEETRWNPIPYLKWALEEVEEVDLIAKLTKKFGSTHEIDDEDMERLQEKLASRDFSMTVQHNTPDRHTTIQAKMVVVGDGNVVGGNNCDRRIVNQDSDENLSQDSTNNLSSSVVDGPCETIGLVEGSQVLFSDEAFSAIVGKTCVIQVTIDETYRPDHVIWRWKQNEEDDYSKILHSEKYIVGDVNNPSLTITDAQKSDEGHYMCQVANALGSVNSRDIFLEICGVLPKIDVKIAQNPVRGATVILNCKIKSLPDLVSVIWHKNGEVLRMTSKHNGGTIHEPSLTISTVDDTDEAEYMCKVTNLVGPGTSNLVTLNIIDEPTVRIEVPTLVLTGRTTTIDCNVSSTEPITELTWLKDGYNIQPESDSNKYAGGSIHTPSLTIHNCDDQDKASYRCKARNIAGTGQSAVVQLDVAEKPKINLSFQSPVLRGKTSKIDCSITSIIPLISIQWYMDFEKISPTSCLFSGGTLEEPSLTLVKLSDNHEGKYRCEVSNEAGTLPSEDVVIKIADLPVISLSSKKYTVEAAGFVTLRCQIKGNPTPKRVEWYKVVDEKKIPISKSLKYSGGTVKVPSLTIGNVVSNDAGLYVMYAQNDFGDSWSEKITVEGEMPRINLSADSSVLSGKSITIMCHLKKSDMISLNWFKDGCALLLDSKHYIGGNMDSPHLTITAVSKLDEGKYTCKASNRFGTSSESVSFKVIFCKPQLSIDESRISIQAGTTVQLRCKIISEPSITRITWHKTDICKSTQISASERYKGGSVEQPTLTIMNTNINDSGVYFCEVENIAGTVRSDDVQLDVKGDKPVITVQSEMNACDGELVNIDCKIDAKPDIYSLQWYRIIDGQLVELLQTSKHYTGGNTRHPALSIVNIAKDDEGTYICKASNSVGEGLSGECKLKVFCKPRVLVETSSISCSTGQTISLKCRIQADPAVKHIHWSKGEGFTKQRWKIIEKTENKAMERSIIPSFTIRNVQMSDSGHYVCEVTNMVGTTRSEPIILDVTTGITTKSKPIIQDITTDIPDSNTILLAYTADVDTVRTFKEHILEVLVEKNDIHVDEFIIKDDVDREFLYTVDRTIQSAKIVFLLLSKDFVDKAWPNVSSMSNLTGSLYSRQSLIVPVYLEQSINLPMGLRSLMCLYFYRHDNVYKKALGKLMKELL